MRRSVDKARAETTARREKKGWRSERDKPKGAEVKKRRVKGEMCSK